MACKDHQAPPVLQVRQELQLPDPATKLALFMFGAQPPGNWCLTRETLPPGWVCVICSGGRPLTAQPLPPNFQLAAGDAYTPDLVRDGGTALRPWQCGPARLISCRVRVELKRLSTPAWPMQHGVYRRLIRQAWAVCQAVAAQCMQLHDGQDWVCEHVREASQHAGVQGKGGRSW